MNNVGIWLIVAAIATAAWGAYKFRTRITELVWKLCFKYLSDEKIEEMVRFQYESFKENRRNFTNDGIDWLLQMSDYLVCIWQHKADLSLEFCLNEYSDEVSSEGALSSEFLQLLKQKHGKHAKILAYWQEARHSLTCEINLRKYFNS